MSRPAQVRGDGELPDVVRWHKCAFAIQHFYEAYAGTAVVTENSAEYAYVQGRAVRRSRRPLTRGLNKNYNRFLKNVLKSAAAAVGRPGPLRDLYEHRVSGGMREDMARLSLARKLAAVACDCGNEENSSIRNC